MWQTSNVGCSMLVNQFKLGFPMGRDRSFFIVPGQRDKLKIHIQKPCDGILTFCHGTCWDGTRDRRKKIQFLKKQMFYFDTKLVILSRDVPGQRILLWDFCSCLCPETKGTRGQELFSVRDKETTGRPIPVCLGLSHPIWKP